MKKKEKIREMKKILESVISMDKQGYLVIKNPASQELFIKEVKGLLEKVNK